MSGYRTSQTNFIDLRMRTAESRIRTLVLLPTVTADLLFQKAIQSLDHNSEPHDVLIIGDGCDPQLVEALKVPNNKVFLHLETNIGITAALNEGMKWAHNQAYDFIARMDSDDISYPGRLARQREFMDMNPEVVLCGTAVRYLTEEGTEPFQDNPPTTHDRICHELKFRNPFRHPTLFFRSCLLENIGFYDPQFLTSQDYDFVWRASRRGRVAILPEVQLDYLVRDDSISSSRFRQASNSLRVKMKHFDAFSFASYLGFLKAVATMFFDRRTHNRLVRLAQRIRRRQIVN